MIEILGIILWYVVGCAGFVYWWTTEHKFRVYDLDIMLFAGFIGPFSWFVGWNIHGKGRTFFERRNK